MDRPIAYRISLLLPLKFLRLLAPLSVGHLLLLPLVFTPLPVIPLLRQSIIPWLVQDTAPPQHPGQQSMIDEESHLLVRVLPTTRV